jgi:hypothetical protein
VTRPVDRVVEASLLVRDRRSIHVGLTPAGHLVLERAIAAHIENHRSAPEEAIQRRGPRRADCDADQDRWLGPFPKQQELDSH